MLVGVVALVVLDVVVELEVDVEADVEVELEVELEVEVEVELRVVDRRGGGGLEVVRVVDVELGGWISGGQDSP